MSLSPNKKQRIWFRDRFICFYCGLDLKEEFENRYPSDKLNITVDHIVAVSDGGDNKDINLVTACRACNNKKGSNKGRSVTYKNA